MVEKTSDFCDNVQSAGFKIDDIQVRFMVGIGKPLRDVVEVIPDAIEKFETGLIRSGYSHGGVRVIEASSD
jgi:hypothetical protein